MLTVGEKFPAFTLQGINSNNEFVEVGMRDDEQQCLGKSFTFILKTSLLYVQQKSQAWTH